MRERLTAPRTNSSPPPYKSPTPASTNRNSIDLATLEEPPVKGNGPSSPLGTAKAFVEDPATQCRLRRAICSARYVFNGLLGEADGWYLEGGYRIPNTNWEVDLRYDRYNRLTDDRFEINFDTWTAGIQYFFNKKTRLNFNYSARDYNAPNFPDGAGPNAQLTGVDGRAAIQLTHIF